MGDLKCIEKLWLGWSELFVFDTCLDTCLESLAGLGVLKLKGWSCPEFKHFTKVEKNKLTFPVPYLHSTDFNFVFKLLAEGPLVKHFDEMSQTFLCCLQ